MKTVVASKCMTDSDIRAKRGTHFHEYSQLFRESVQVVDERGRVLACFLKNTIPPDTCNKALVYEPVGKQESINRGNAAGSNVTNPRAINIDTAKKLYESDTRKVESGIMGYLDSSNWRSPCRETAFLKHHVEAFREGLEYIQCISTLYKEHAPDQYQRQYEQSRKSPEYIIDGTVFSTVTVNHNFQTALHVDRGDFGGFGNIAVVERGHYEGGYTVMPQYGLAFDVRNGDVLFLDVHQFHSNTPIISDGASCRLSFVCYLRRNMYKCPDLEVLVPCQAHLTTQQKVWHMLAGDPKASIPTSCPENAVYEDLGKGAQGHQWYSLTSPHATVRYKNKGYTVTLRWTEDGEPRSKDYDVYGGMTYSYYDFIHNFETNSGSTPSRHPS